MFSEENTTFDTLSSTYDVAAPVEGMFSRDEATISSIGNRLYAIGDGSQEAMYIGKGPVGSGAEVYPDETLYTQEWSRFPKCQYYARGPKATIFAAGNPDKPLTVYISEPAGLTSSFKDSPYSTEDVSDLYNSGRLSTVDILGSDASKITALSTRGDQVVVHTDKGAFLLYAPAPDQASTGYRVEQAAATNFSSAASHKVVSGEGGTQTFWVGHDGQVYKDEAASRGSAELKSNSDQDQANWKSKGIWEHELPTDLSDSFSVFSGQTGDYLFFVESNEALGFDFKDDELARVVNESHSEDPEFYFSCVPSQCPSHGDGAVPSCCKRFVGLADPDSGKYETCQDCVENSSSCSGTGCCCEDFEVEDDMVVVGGNTVDELIASGYSPDVAAQMLIEDAEICCWKPFTTKFEFNGCLGCKQSETGSFDTYDACITSWFENSECLYDYADCGECEVTANGSYFSEDDCKEALKNDSACKSYKISNCACVEDPAGNFTSLSDCETDLNTNSDNDSCWKYAANGCSCEKASDGIYDDLSTCETYLKTLSECMGYNLNGCDCVYALNGTYADEETCKNQTSTNSLCQGYNLVGCNCELDTSGDPQYELLRQCESAVNQLSNCNTWDLVGCECQRNNEGVGAYPSQELCEEDAASSTECKKYTITECECVESETGTITGKTACETVLEANTECKKYTLTSDCECIEDANGSFESLSDCDIERQKCTEYEIFDCTCTEFEGGSYTGLEACHAELDQRSEECPGFSIAGCSCVSDPSGPFSSMSDCQTALAIDEACNGFWRFPVAFNFDGVAQENQCECQLAATDNEGMFAKKSACQDALKAIRPGEQYPYCWADCADNRSSSCCECSDTPIFNPEYPCSIPTPTGNWGYTYYCSSEGGSASYIENYGSYCNFDTSLCWDGVGNNLCYSGYDKPSDYVNDCEHVTDPETGEVSTLEGTCGACPEAKYIIEFSDSGGCGCVQRVPTEQDLHVYDTENECLDGRLAICATYITNTPSCACEPVYDGSGTGLASCEATLDVTSGCERYTINDSCECVQDAAGVIRGQSTCESLISSDPDCQPHWIDNCACTSTDPNNGTPSFNGEVQCLTHLDENHPECFCDNTSTDYFVDETDGSCAFMGGGGGTHTECQCIEEGRTIFQ